MRGWASSRSSRTRWRARHHVEQDHHARPVRDEIAPVVGSGRASGVGDDLEVLGAVGVGQDHEVGRRGARPRSARSGRAAATSTRRRGRVGAVDQPDLGGLVVADRDGQEAARRGHVDVDEPAGRRLLVDSSSSSAGVPSRWRRTRAGRWLSVKLDVDTATGNRRAQTTWSAVAGIAVGKVARRSRGRECGP